MEAAAHPIARRHVGRGALASSITVAGLGAAAVDATYFTVKALVAGASPVGVLRAIAGFWLGKAAAADGLESPVIGAATHVGLAMVMAAGFVLLQPRLKGLRGPALLVGPAYGVGLYVVMYFIVLPLRWPGRFPSFDGWATLGDVLVHAAVGLAIVRLARRGSARAHDEGRPGAD